MEQIKSLIPKLSAAELAELTLELKQSKRSKIAEMSSEVVDSNPYSRLMALKRMGIVENYEKIREYTVAVVGKFVKSGLQCENYRIFLSLTFYVKFKYANLESQNLPLLISRKI